MQATIATRPPPFDAPLAAEFLEFLLEARSSELNITYDLIEIKSLMALATKLEAGSDVRDYDADYIDGVTARLGGRGGLDGQRALEAAPLRTGESALGRVEAVLLRPETGECVKCGARHVSLLFLVFASRLTTSLAQRFTRRARRGASVSSTS